MQPGISHGSGDPVIDLLIELKRFLAISFLAVYLLSATELSQLLKMPALISHFEEHKALNSSLSLADFLCMHYTGHDLNDNDDDRDRQLPFKSHDNSLAIDLQTVPQHPQSFTFSTLPAVTNTATDYMRLDLQSSYLSGIWQPPRAC